MERPRPVQVEVHRPPLKKKATLFERVKDKLQRRQHNVALASGRVSGKFIQNGKPRGK